MKRIIRSIAQPGGRAALVSLALSLIGLIFLAACDGGGGSEGGATIRGTVASFDGQTAHFVPVHGSRSLAGIIAEILELAVPSAPAAIGGVNVSVAGTSLSSTTGNDGFFVVSGVPPGMRQLVFSLNADSGLLDLDVPNHSEIDLGDVRVSSGQAHPSKVDIKIVEDDDDHGSGSDNDNETEDGNEGGDDDGDGNDDGVEDNGNDNGIVNGEDNHSESG